ncbi:MAG: ATP-binding protein [Dysgonamonadaceae bacterium]|jgi:hypothetical protein|nr:ATP-binding protein [Dysgonamonadaceae bacterium]
MGNKMVNSKIKVSGNILSELSEKIPTNIIALNELIKNSYDAGSSLVSITIDTNRKLFIIKDDGSGMNKDDIDTLFHISKSTKIHGKKNEFNRITQGSKGLGFLSVFKFGKNVEWKTKKDKGYSFSVDFSKLIAMDDISQCEIELIENKDIGKGTEITINLDDYTSRILKDYLADEKNYKKILHSFNDNDFTINLKIDDSSYSSKELKPFLENEKKYQLYHVIYNSDDQNIIFYYNGHKIMGEIFSFDSANFKLDIDILIFQLKPHGKEKIDKLFVNHKDDLTPLIYYNSNLFNNYDLFDPNIMKNIKTDLVLNQMIGYININSENQSIDFNSDRSQFLQNEVTDSIVEFLKKINRFIQEIGGEKKKHLMDFDILWTQAIPLEYYNITDKREFKKLIREDFAFRNLVKIKIKNDGVLYSLFGKSVLLKKENVINTPYSARDTKNKTRSNNQKNDIPAKINLNCQSEIEITIPSSQLNLLDYIASIYDSQGRQIDKNQLDIEINKKKVKSNILSSIKKPCIKIVEYVYKDETTGPAINSLKLVFKESISVITSNRRQNKLIAIPAKENYIIKYNSTLGDLINEINNLNIKNYKGVISCSLRIIFEISVNAIATAKKHSNIFLNLGNDFEKKVIKIINHIKSNSQFVSAIAVSTGINYHTLNNILIESDFSSAIKKSHIAVHQTTELTMEDDIRYIAKYASFFAVITNEMLFNSKIG